jgi:hypothetical protein
MYYIIWCVFVVLCTQHEQRMRHVLIVICGLVAIYRLFSHYLTNDTIFGKKTLNITRVFWFSTQFCLKYFSSQEEFNEILLKMYVNLSIK